MELTEAHINTAREAGACNEELECVRPGMQLHEVSPEALGWVEANLPDLAAQAVREELRGKAEGFVPLRMLSASGHGDGYGEGYVDGDGYGHGDGDGHGYGYGYGSGHGEEDELRECL